MKVANWMTHIDYDWHSRSGATGWWTCRGVMSSSATTARAAACPTGRCWTTFDAWVRDLETVVEAAGWTVRSSASRRARPLPLSRLGIRSG